MASNWSPIGIYDSLRASEVLETSGVIFNFKLHLFILWVFIRP